jgi:hypothetical protein
MGMFVEVSVSVTSQSPMIAPLESVTRPVTLDAVCAKTDAVNRLHNNQNKAIFRISSPFQSD